MWAAPIKNGVHYHIYFSQKAVACCGIKDAVEVVVRPGKGYWAWWDAKKKHLCLIWSRKILLEACFTYGMQVAIDRGNGVPVEVEVEAI